MKMPNEFIDLVRGIMFAIIGIITMVAVAGVLSNQLVTEVTVISIVLIIVGLASAAITLILKKLR